MYHRTFFWLDSVKTPLSTSTPSYLDQKYSSKSPVLLHNVLKHKGMNEISIIFDTGHCGITPNPSLTDAVLHEPEQSSSSHVFNPSSKESHVFAGNGKDEIQESRA